MATITVFGSSFPNPGDKEYEDAFKLGQLLGENDFNVCSGGYQGIMDAVSKGVREKGGEAIGVTVETFNAKPSEHLTEIIECDSLFERIKTLVTIADGFVILNGGTGTLLELAVIWEYFNKELIKPRPAVAHGKMWNNIITEMENRIAVEKRKLGLIKTCDTIEGCVETIIKLVKD
jgi:uncharacterized protein (TIGR00730 family)